MARVMLCYDCLPVLFCYKLFVSTSKFCQVLKAELKKCVIKITAIDLQKGIKNTSFIKTSRSPAFSHWAVYNHTFNTNPFLPPFERLESYAPNVSLAVWTPGVTRLKFFVSRLNGWHHPFKIFHSLFERLASSIWNFSCAVQTVGIIRSKFFQCRSNVYSNRLKFFHGRSNGIWNHFSSVR